MRLECPKADWDNFKKIMRNNHIKTVRLNKYKGEVLPSYLDCSVVTFSCNTSRDFLIEIMKNEGADLHYAYDTIKPVETYTGNRFEDFYAELNLPYPH